jgi:hypothetical protein
METTVPNAERIQDLPNASYLAAATKPGKSFFHCVITEWKPAATLPTLADWPSQC